MRRRRHPFFILVGCFLIMLGFILPWYGDKIFNNLLTSTPISGLQLWLGVPSAGLTYAPGVVPEFFALLWIVPVAVLCIGACSVGELLFPRWNDRWLRLGIYTMLLLLLLIFLWAALMQGQAQIGLGLSLFGWVLIALGTLLGFRRSSSDPLTREAAPASAAYPTRRTVLRGLVGMVGLASLGGIGGFLLWKTWRTHNAIFTYRYSNPGTGQISSDDAPFNAVLTVDWSPDGRRILVAQLHAPPQSWDALTGEQKQTYQPADAVAAAWSPDGRQIALSQNSFTDQSFLVVVNAATGAREAALSLDDSQMNGLACFAWSPDSQQLALADADHLTITLWNPATGEFGITLTIPSQDQPGLNRLQDVVWSPDGQYLAAAIPEADMLPDGTISPGGSLTAAGLSSVYIWQVQSRALLLHHQAEIPPFNSSLLSWSPDGQRLAFANKTTVQVLDLALQRLVLTYTGHVLVPLSVAWSPNGKYLASGGVDQTVQVWEAATGALRFLYQGHNAAVYDIAWSPDGSYLASGSGDGTAQVWQPEL